MHPLAGARLHLATVTICMPGRRPTLLTTHWALSNSGLPSPVDQSLVCRRASLGAIEAAKGQTSSWSAAWTGRRLGAAARAAPLECVPGGFGIVDDDDDAVTWSLHTLSSAWLRTTATKHGMW